MLNRRHILKTALHSGLAVNLSGRSAASTEIWVNPVAGDDRTSGHRDNPLRTLAEAARRINADDGSGPVTIYLSEGIHPIGETIVIRSERHTFTSKARLTIRAEVLPDDPGWDTARMPVLIHTMPLSPSWNGRPDPLGGAADGMLIETSHVTIQGLKFLGIPVVESPKPGLIRRLYTVSRLRRDLEDLEIAQCMFLGDDVISPLHVAVIAHGNGVNVHHRIFRGLKISVVYWTAGSRGHAMTHCFCDNVYGSAVWTENIPSGFDDRNNVVSNCNYVWTQSRALSVGDAQGRGGQPGTSASVKPPDFVRYKVVNCYFAGNRRLVGSGPGARQQYADLDPALLELTET